MSSDGKEPPGMNALTAMSRAEPGSAGAVKAVSVISTGSVRIHPEQPYGTRKPLYWWLLTSQRWTPPRPINVYVIEHAKGLILFDTGQDRASVTDDTYFPGGVTGYLYHRLARFDIGADDTLTAQLATLGYNPADVDTAIVSHLNEDHIGGLGELAGSDLLVSAAEWAEMAKPAPELRGFLRNRIQLPGLTWHQVSPERTDDPAKAPLLLTGDLTYGADILERGQVPGVGNRRRLAESSRKVLALAERQPGLVVLPAHDPTAAQRLLNS